MTTARIRRILVAVDASPESRRAAEEAAGVAAALEADLEGLFVEDPELLRLAAAPLAQRIDALTASAERLDDTGLRRHLRAQAGRARRALDRAAASHGVRWSFRVARGRVVSEILSARADGVLVSVGRMGWSARQHPRLGSTARALLGDHRPLLLAPRPRQRGSGVAVLFDGSDAASEALRLAARLAGRRGGDLLVLLAGPRPEELQQAAAAAGGEHARFATVDATSHGEIAAAVRAAGSALLVLPLADRLEELDRLLAEVSCGVLVVR